MILCVSVTNATSLRIVQDKAFIAGAHETTECVGAMPILANILMFFTFINVFQNNGHAIRSVPWSTGA